MFIFLLGRMYLINVTAFSSLFLPCRSACSIFKDIQSYIECHWYVSSVLQSFPIFSKGRQNLTGLRLFFPYLCEVNSELKGILEGFLPFMVVFKNKRVFQEMLYVQWSVMRKWVFSVEERLLKLQQQVSSASSEKR